MITNEEKEEIRELYERLNRGRWWYNVVNVHSNYEELKRGIESDFIAWGLLGACLTSISFVGGLFENAIDVNSVPEYFNGFRSTLKCIYLTCFMFAGIQSMKCVVCGTFKYIFFVTVPNDKIIIAIKTYIENEMCTPKCNHWYDNFIPNLWEHVTPVLLASYSIVVGCCLGIYIRYGLKIAFPMILLSCYHCYITRTIKKRLWNHVYIYFDNCAKDKEMKKINNEYDYNKSISTNVDDNDDEFSTNYKSYKINQVQNQDNRRKSPRRSRVAEK